MVHSLDRETIENPTLRLLLSLLTCDMIPAEADEAYFWGQPKTNVLSRTSGFFVAKVSLMYPVRSRIKLIWSQFSELWGGRVLRRAKSRSSSMCITRAGSSSRSSVWLFIVLFLTRFNINWIFVATTYGTYGCLPKFWHVISKHRISKHPLLKPHSPWPVKFEIIESPLDYGIFHRYRLQKPWR